MRYKVQTRYGYVSYDERDEAKARALYADEGVCLRLTADLGDDVGVILEGTPLNMRKSVAA